MNNSRRRYNNTKNNPSNDVVDRISDLPDNLIQRILALLPTTDVVATSVLSKRWMSLWIYINVLDFTDLPPRNSDSGNLLTQQQYASFRNFVNNMFLSNQATCLERVHFDFYQGFSAEDIKEWMLALSQRCIKELHLNSNDELIRLPSTFFLGKNNLVVLNLNGFKLYFSSAIHLPCLKILSLINVEFASKADPLSYLIPYCPSLKEVSIDCCDDGLKMFSVCSKSIRILRITSMDKVFDRHFVLKTPNLIYLDISWAWLSIGFMESLVTEQPLLIEARVRLWASRLRWIKFLQSICTLKALVLYQIKQPFKGYRNFLDIPIFVNLTRLEVEDTAWSHVLQILFRAPNLVSFIILKNMKKWPADIFEYKVGLPLKRIEFYGLDDFEESFEVIRYFLSSCYELKELKIYISRWLDAITEIEILKRLLKIPRSSIQCEINVVTERYESDSDSSDDSSQQSESSILYPEDLDPDFRIHYAMNMFGP